MLDQNQTDTQNKNEELQDTVNRLRAEKTSLKSIPLGKLLKIWEDYDGSDE